MESALANESSTPPCSCSPLRSPRSTPFGGRPPGATVVTSLECRRPESRAQFPLNGSDCLLMHSVRMAAECYTAAPATGFSRGDTSSDVLPTVRPRLRICGESPSPSAPLQTAVHCNTSLTDVLLVSSVQNVHTRSLLRKRLQHGL